MQFGRRSSPAANHDVAFLIVTFDRIGQARANAEIIRNVLRPQFRDSNIVHAYNGLDAWWPDRENEGVIDVANGKADSHYVGAARLLDSGMQHIRDTLPQVNYVVALSSDAWLTNADWLSGVIDRMRTESLPLAAASWDLDPNVVDMVDGSESGLSTRGLTTDFFVADINWGFEHQLFPLALEDFLTDSKKVDLAMRGKRLLLEAYFQGKFVVACGNELASLRQWHLTELEQGGNGNPFDPRNVRYSVLRDPLGSRGAFRAAESLLDLSPQRPIDRTGMLHSKQKGAWPGIGFCNSEDPDVKAQLVDTLIPLLGGDIAVTAPTLAAIHAGNRLLLGSERDPRTTGRTTTDDALSTHSSSSVAS